MPTKKNNETGPDDSWIKEALKDWELENFDDLEFINWNELPKEIHMSTLMSDKHEANYLYIKVNWNTLNPKWRNNYGNLQPIVQVNKLVPFNDTFHEFPTSYLAMGKRLFNRMRQALKSGWKYIEIVRIMNPDNKYDTQYYIREKKLTKQTKIHDFSF